MVKCLIFSKNRPAQLDLCIRSHKRFWGEDIKVLFKCDKEYVKGYNRVKKLHPDVEFEKETDFRKQVIDNLEGEFTCYDCDDTVMIRPFSEDEPEFKEFARNPDILACVLKMGRNYDYCFDSDVSVKIPRFIDGMWQWKKHPHDWAYPMSVCLNIFRTEDLRAVIPHIRFDSPNSLEAEMDECHIDKDLLIGFEEAKCVNIPSNRVQNEVLNNRAGNLSTKELNDKFLAGYEIDIDDIINKTKNLRSFITLLDYEWRPYGKPVSKR
jgi:hypothetical protein